MNKRQIALDRIRIQVAKTGSTAGTISIWLDHRISRAAYDQACRAGMNHFRACQANPDQARCKTYAEVREV